MLFLSTSQRFAHISAHGRALRLSFLRHSRRKRLSRSQWSGRVINLDIFMGLFKGKFGISSLEYVGKYLTLWYLGIIFGNNIWNIFGKYDPLPKPNHEENPKYSQLLSNIWFKYDFFLMISCFSPSQLKSTLAAEASKGRPWCRWVLLRKKYGCVTCEGWFSALTPVIQMHSEHSDGAFLAEVLQYLVATIGNLSRLQNVRPWNEGIYMDLQHLIISSVKNVRIPSLWGNVSPGAADLRLTFNTGEYESPHKVDRRVITDSYGVQLFETHIRVVWVVNKWQQYSGAFGFKAQPALPRARRQHPHVGKPWQPWGRRPLCHSGAPHHPAAEFTALVVWHPGRWVGNHHDG